MDSIWVVLIPQAGSKSAPLVEIDSEADVVIIVPPPLTPQTHPGTGRSAVLYNPAGLRIKVSAKHLRTASPIFRSKLAYFHPSTSTQPDGRIHLRLANVFGPKAVYLVLSALHPGPATARLPKQLESLETLAQVSLFADKFALNDIVEVYAVRWINRLWKGPGGNKGRDWALWAYVAYVFGREDIFELASRRVIEEHRGGVRFEDLFDSVGLSPSREFIVELESRHSRLLGNAITAVNNVLDKIILVEDNCQCGTSLLGTLVAAMSKSGTLRWPARGNTGENDQFTASYADLVAAIKGAITKFGSWRASISPKGSRAVTPIVTKADPLGVNGINGKLWTPDSSPRLENGGDGFSLLEKHTCALDDLVKSLESVFSKRV